MGRSVGRIAPQPGVPVRDIGRLGDEAKWQSTEKSTWVANMERKSAIVMHV